MLLIPSSKVECEIVLNETEGRLTTGTFYLEIRSQVHDSSTVESKAEYKTFENAIQKLSNYEGRLGQLNTQLAQIDNQKATKDELNALGKLKIEGEYSTLALLQTAKPTGAPGLYLIIADGYTYRWDGVTWVRVAQFQSTGIADKSVSIDKTDFITRSSNLYNKQKIVLGQYITSTGTIGNNETYFRTEYIPVDPTQTRINTLYVTNIVR